MYITKNEIKHINSWAVAPKINDKQNKHSVCSVIEFM